MDIWTKVDFSYGNGIMTGAIKVIVTSLPGMKRSVRNLDLQRCSESVPSPTTPSTSQGTYKIYIETFK